MTEITTRSATTTMSDAELIAATRTGDEAAYGELWRRHLPAAQAAARSLTRSKADADDAVADGFARVLNAIKNGGGPQVSFRPYLLTSVRNSFFDKTRRDKRVDGAEPPPDHIDLAALANAESEDDRRLIAAAFATLPERWQLVLWHTEVEGMNPAEVAPLLGVAPNAVAALSYRAREGLRQAYLQAHLQRPTPPDCEESRPKLGAYVRDGLSMRDRTKVDRHLEDCNDCKALLVDLQSANQSLRGVLIPMLLGVPAVAYLGHLGVGAKGIFAFLKSPGKARNAAVGTSAVAAGLVAVAAFAAVGGEEPVALPRPAAITTVVVVDDSAAPSPTSGVVTVADPTDPTIVTTPPEAFATMPPTTLATTTVAPTLPAGFIPETSAPNGSTTLDSTTLPPQPTTTTRPATTTTTAAPTTTRAPTTTTTTTTTLAPTTLPPTTIAAKPAITLTATQTAPAIAGQVGYVTVQATNAAGAGAAPDTTVTLTLPGGVAINRSSNSAWACTSNAPFTCTIGALAPGAISTTELELSIPSGLAAVPFGARARSGTSTSPDSRLALALSAPTNANVTYMRVLRGGVAIAGNSSMTCAAADARCADARQGIAGAPNDLNRQNHAMTFVNQDSLGTVNASSATITVPVGATIKHALLTWTGNVGDPNASTLSPGTVDLITPNGVRTAITAQRTYTPAGGIYASNADVTSLVSAGGTYTVADIAARTGASAYAGWALIVAYADPSAAERIVVVADRSGVLGGGNPATFIQSGLAPITGDRAVQLASFAAEGELGLTGDNVTVNGVAVVDGTNPVENFFNSSGPSGRVPNDVNLFGNDIDLVSVSVPGSSTSFTLDMSSDGDRINLLGLALGISR